jgi:alpha-glucosidase
MGMVLKHPALLDNPPNPDYRPGMPEFTRLLGTNSLNFPDVYGAVEGIRRVFDEFEGSVAVGEVFGSPSVIAGFYGADDLTGLHLNFNFHLIGPDGQHAPWDAQPIGAIVSTFDDLPAHAQPCYALGNHDRSRFISRHNHDGNGNDRARAACLFLLGLRATPYIYYGEEIGMVDVEVPEDRLHDPARFHLPGRDPERTPMQWDDSPGRGFTEGEPWLPFGPAGINVNAQRNDSGSLLSLYRRALRIRKQELALHGGGFRALRSAMGTFAFERPVEGSRSVVCALNTIAGELIIDLPEGGWEMLLGSHDGSEIRAGNRLHLPALSAA